VKWCCSQFVSHSIPFFFSQENASLGLVSGAQIVEPLTGEPKSASIGWAGFFSGSAGAFAGTDGAGFGAISGICRCENLGGLNRIPPFFILDLWIKLGRGRPHSVVSLSRDLREDRLCNTLRIASSKKNMAAAQSNGVKSEKLPGKGRALMAYELFPCPHGRRSHQAVCVLAGAFARLPGREF
jgi:hypothetical protein